MSNRLQFETSPYLLQHKDDPVDWYPWSEEAFKRAENEDKPIFLSIGYSSCHWCHVMRHESFTDGAIAELLNKYFISIKVDREERPDIDSVYMAACIALTGSGGWPMSIFMTHDRKPFLAGTYFPKSSGGGIVGFGELLTAIHELWLHRRSTLLRRSEELTAHLRAESGQTRDAGTDAAPTASGKLIKEAVGQFKRSYDAEFGGFGPAPKFPTPHNLIFLLSYYERYNDEACLKMAEHTLTQMYRGGLFDHIGGGFCRYSTDAKFLIPHFEKMLYDNALLILAYCKAFSITKQELYLHTAERTARFVMEHMTSPDGGFYSALDADSEGEEGGYYAFAKDEIVSLLGKADGEAFCAHYGITDTGNFEGRSIPNLLMSDYTANDFENFLPKLEKYRNERSSLSLDDKVLTGWNGLMIAAMSVLYLVSGRREYLDAAVKADGFIQSRLYDGTTLFASFAGGKRGAQGFLDDYAAYILSQLALQRAALKTEYLARAEQLFKKAVEEFGSENGGFYLYGKQSEKLITRPIETYDGAVPSGNSMMACALVRLELLTGNIEYRSAANSLLDRIAADAESYPMGHAFFLKALMEYLDPPMKVTIAPAPGDAEPSAAALVFKPDTAVVLLDAPSEDYPLKNGKTTYYMCSGHMCMPPVNSPDEDARLKF